MARAALGSVRGEGGVLVGLIVVALLSSLKDIHFASR